MHVVPAHQEATDDDVGNSVMSRSRHRLLKTNQENFEVLVDDSVCPEDGRKSFHLLLYLFGLWLINNF